MFGFIGDAIGKVASGVKNVAGGAVNVVKKTGSLGVGAVKLGAKVSVGFVKANVNVAKAVASTPIGRNILKAGAIAGTSLIGQPEIGIAGAKALDYATDVKENLDKANELKKEYAPVFNAVKAQVSPQQAQRNQNVKKTQVSNKITSANAMTAKANVTDSHTYAPSIYPSSPKAVSMGRKSTGDSTPEKQDAPQVQTASMSPVIIVGAVALAALALRGRK